MPASTQQDLLHSSEGANEEEMFRIYEKLARRSFTDRVRAKAGVDTSEIIPDYERVLTPRMEE